MGVASAQSPGEHCGKREHSGQHEESDKTYRFHFVGLPRRGLLRALSTKRSQDCPEPSYRGMVVQGSQDHERIPPPQVYIFTFECEWTMHRAIRKIQREVENFRLILCHGVLLPQFHRKMFLTNHENAKKFIQPMRFNLSCQCLVVN